MLPPREAPLAAVLDTNVVLDLLVFEDPQLRPLLAALESGALTAWADAATLAELQHVLAYPSFALDVATQRACMQRYAERVRTLATGGGAPVPALPRCADRDDQKFLELAARAGAAWLVSRDKQLLQLRGWSSLPFLILRPREAVERVQASR